MKFELEFDLHRQVLNCDDLSLLFTWQDINHAYQLFNDLVEYKGCTNEERYRVIRHALPYLVRAITRHTESLEGGAS